MAVLPSLDTIGGLIINIVHNFWSYMIPCKICQPGEALIKKQLGKPIQEVQEPGLYWKIPIFEEFDVVNTKKQTLYIFAHSFLMPSRLNKTLPTNIVIDAQVEYRIKEPTCIYHINEKSITTFVENKVHEIIANVVNSKDIEEKIASYDIYKDIKNQLENDCNIEGEKTELKKDNNKKWTIIPLWIIVSSLLLYPLAKFSNIYMYFNFFYQLCLFILYCLINIFVNLQFCRYIEKKLDKTVENSKDNNNTKNANVIKIEKIIITSFDYNFSLRLTQ